MRELDRPNDTSSSGGQECSSPLELMFVGAVVPDLDAWRTPAFSRSGNQLQIDFLDAMQDAGLSCFSTLSYVPTPAWPRGTLWVAGRNLSIGGRHAIHEMAFLNIPAFKVIWISLAAAFHIIKWRMTSGTAKMVVCYNLSVPNAAVLWAVCRACRIPLVFFVCDIDVPGQTIPNSLAAQLDWQQQRWTLPRADALIAVSEDVPRNLAPSTPALIVPGGLRDERIAELSSASPSVTDRIDGVFHVLLAGSLTEVNGVREFLDAAASAPSDVHFWVAGGGPLANDVEKAAARSENLRYFGALEQARLFSLMRAADLLVNMRIRSRLQSDYFFPGKFFEFVSSGTLTASTDVGTPMHHLGETIVLIGKDSALGLLDAIRRARDYSPELRYQMGARARARMAQRYSWSSQGPPIVKFLRDTARSRTAAEWPAPHIDSSLT